jgi:hypothetical protein
MSGQSEAIWGSVLFLLLGGCFFVLSGDMPEWVHRTVRRLTFRTAVGTIATAFFVRGITLIPDKPLLAWYMCLVGVLLFGVVFAAGVVAHQHFVSIRDALGLFLAQADELMDRLVTTQSAYDVWVTDLNLWYRTANKFLEERVSATDAVLFRDMSQGGRYSERGFNPEHMDYKTSLRKYMTNLKRITESHLSTKT